MNMPGLTDLLAHDMVKPLEKPMYFPWRQTYSQEVWLCNISKGYELHDSRIWKTCVMYL